MNNLKMLLPTIAFCLTLQIVCSCDKIKNVFTQASTDTIWNEHIQNVFFGVPFGATSQQVIDGFAKHDLTIDKSLSTKSWLVFYYSKGEKYSFGNLDWKNLSVRLQNDKFFSIRFEMVEEVKDKDVAMDFFNCVVDELGKKYKLIKEETTDTTIYGSYNAYGRDKRKISVVCEKYKSYSTKNTYIYTDLYYSDSTYYNAPSNEL